jgi:hypothetical protein
MYNALIHLYIRVDNNKMIWKIKIRLKLRFSGGIFVEGVILTQKNLAKRNWHHNKSGVVCHQDETIKHLFF